MDRPITTDEIIQVHDVLRESTSLTDSGIGPMCWFSAVGVVCSLHGPIERYVESFDGPPQDEYITCVMCLRFGIVRRCPVPRWERIHPHLL